MSSSDIITVPVKVYTNDTRKCVTGTFSFVSGTIHYELSQKLQQRLEVRFPMMHVRVSKSQVYTVPKTYGNPQFREWGAPIDSGVKGITVFLDLGFDLPEENWTLSMVEPAHPSEHAPKDGS